MRPLVTPAMKKSISSRERFSPSLFFLMTSCGLKQLSLVALHKHSGLSGHSEPLPHRIDAFTRLRLHTHTTGINSQHSGDVFAHGVDVAPESWCFEQNCRINVHYVETAFARQPHHTRKQFKTFGATPLWILVREMNSKIAFTKRAKNRIGNRVRQCISVRVAVTAALGHDMHTSKH